MKLEDLISALQMFNRRVMSIKVDQIEFDKAKRQLKDHLSSLPNGPQIVALIDWQKGE